MPFKFSMPRFSKERRSQKMELPAYSSLQSKQTSSAAAASQDRRRAPLVDVCASIWPGNISRPRRILTAYSELVARVLIREFVPAPLTTPFLCYYNRLLAEAGSQSSSHANWFIRFVIGISILTLRSSLSYQSGPFIF